MTPEGWRKATYGHAMTETEQRAEGAIDLPVLSVTKTRGPMLASERFGKAMHGRDLGKYRVAPRDYVVADPMLLWDGSIGLQTVVDAGLVSPDYRVYKPAPEVDPKFLGYLVRSPWMLPHYQGGARGTNVRRNRIARSDFLAIPVGLPPLGEQKRIAAILSCVDETIADTQAVITQLQVVKKAILAELFTRGVPGRHTRFKQTQIGEVPEAWDVASIGDLLDETAYGTSAKCEATGKGLPVLRIPNVVTERITTDDLKYAQLSPAEAERYALSEGDLLVIRTNGNPNYVGRSAVVPRLDGTWLYASYLIRLRPRPDRVTSHFLHEALRSERARETMRGAIRTSAGNYNLNTHGISNTLIPVPPSDEQAEIVNAGQTFESRLDAEEAFLRQLRSVRDALTSVLLTGEVRVKPDEDAA